ncbi:MAG: hypothetical protein ABJC09_05065 [Terriglobia bacterium]
MSGHPSEPQLALFAGGECGPLARYRVGRHVRGCARCADEVNQFEDLRQEVAEIAPPDLDWEQLSLEMRANIHVGLEAGQCIRPTHTPGLRWNPRFAVACGSLLLLVAAGLAMRSSAPEVVKGAGPVIESTGSGLELRSGANSMTILNHHGAAAGQTVSSRGEIGARYIDGETGAVTINNVYLE